MIIDGIQRKGQYNFFAMLLKNAWKDIVSKGNYNNTNGKKTLFSFRSAAKPYNILPNSVFLLAIGPSTLISISKMTFVDYPGFQNLDGTSNGTDLKKSWAYY